MAYFIETFDKEESQRVRAAHRAAHIAFLKSHQSKLLACGAKLSEETDEALGGIYLLDVDTRAEAEAFLAQDPLFKADLFAEVRIHRWFRGFIDGKSFI